MTLKTAIRKEVTKEETFAPKINKRASTSRNRPMSTEEYGNMLSKRSASKAALREQIRRENEAKELAECTFEPKLVQEMRKLSGSRSRISESAGKVHEMMGDYEQPVRTYRFNEAPKLPKSSPRLSK